MSGAQKREKQRLPPSPAQDGKLSFLLSERSRSYLGWESNLRRGGGGRVGHSHQKVSHPSSLMMMLSLLESELPCLRRVRRRPLPPLLFKTNLLLFCALVCSHAPRATNKTDHMYAKPTFFLFPTHSPNGPSLAPTYWVIFLFSRRRPPFLPSSPSIFNTNMKTPPKKNRPPPSLK